MRVYNIFSSNSKPSTMCYWHLLVTLGTVTLLSFIWSLTVQILMFRLETNWPTCMILLALEVYLALVVSELHYNNSRLLCSLNTSNLVIYLWKSGIRMLTCIFKAGIGWDWLEIFEACCWRMFQILVKNLWGKYAYVCKNMHEPSAKLSSCII